MQSGDFIQLGLARWWFSLASSQGLPALKVAIDDECSGKGLVFTKKNPPDFGLLFLAHFARFQIRTETEVTVHTHSQTNRHSHFCPGFGFSVGDRKFEGRTTGSSTDEASQSLGWNVWLPEALQAGVLRLYEEWWHSQDP